MPDSKYCPKIPRVPVTLGTYHMLGFFERFLLYKNQRLHRLTMYSKSFAQNIKCILGLIFLPPQHKPTKCECQRKLPERRNYLPKRSTPAKVPSWLNWMESKFNFEAEIVETPKSFNSIIDGCNWISLKTIGFRQRQVCVTNHKPVKFKQLWNFQICLISSDEGTKQFYRNINYGLGAGTISRNVSKIRQF